MRIARTSARHPQTFACGVVVASLPKHAIAAHGGHGGCAGMEMCTLDVRVPTGVSYEPAHCMNAHLHDFSNANGVRWPARGWAWSSSELHRIRIVQSLLAKDGRLAVNGLVQRRETAKQLRCGLVHSRLRRVGHLLNVSTSREGFRGRESDTCSRTVGRQPASVSGISRRAW